MVDMVNMCSPVNVHHKIMTSDSIVDVTSHTYPCLCIYEPSDEVTFKNLNTNLWARSLIFHIICEALNTLLARSLDLPISNYILHYRLHPSILRYMGVTHMSYTIFISFGNFNNIYHFHLQRPLSGLNQTFQNYGT